MLKRKHNSGLEGLKKAKCLYWRQIGECHVSDIEAINCGARTKKGYCLSIIVDTKPMGVC